MKCYAQGLLGRTAEPDLQSISQAVEGTVNDLSFRILDLGKKRVNGVNVEIAVSPKRLSAFTGQAA